MTWGFVTCGPNEALVVSGKLNFHYFEIDLYKVDYNRFHFKCHKNEMEDGYPWDFIIIISMVQHMLSIHLM